MTTTITKNRSAATISIKWLADTEEYRVRFSDNKYADSFTPSLEDAIDTAHQEMELFGYGEITMCQTSKRRAEKAEEQNTVEWLAAFDAATAKRSNCAGPRSCDFIRISNGQCACARAASKAVRNV